MNKERYALCRDAYLLACNNSAEDFVEQFIKIVEERREATGKDALIEML
jgi:hypothetical protein